MAFNDFIQTELPKRPFVSTDGAPGQMLVRSNNPLAIRELVWIDAPSGSGNSTLTLEAGSAMLAGQPVRVIDNKLYPAHHETSPRVIGILQNDVLTGYLGTAVTSGRMNVSGLADGAVYYLGAGIVTDIPPASGHVVRIGTAIGTGVLVININLSVLLS